MVRKITLENGLRILCEKLDYVRSCALGIWVQSGSRHEPAELNGISHYIEHMLFKGTEKRTADQLATEFDTVGGQFNAFTTKEHTCFYCQVLRESLPKAAELLEDMFFNSTFQDSQMDLERQVILEEIAMYEDTPDDLVNEQLNIAIYDGQRLGRPILGTPDTLSSMTGETLKLYQNKNYTPENTVISIVGSFEESDLEGISRVFSKMKVQSPPAIEDASYRPAAIVRQKDIEQNHLIIAFPGIGNGDPRRYDAQVLNAILGGGMSSRLFQQVREKAGLCYTIYSFLSAFMGTGIMGVYTALSEKTEKRAIQLIRGVLDDVLERGVTPDEVSRNVTQLKFSLITGRESVTARMTSQARNEFIYGREISEEEMLAGFDAVTPESVLKTARELISWDNVSFSAVGRVGEKEEYLQALKK